ncbi:hypothetical protein [Bacillus sp. Marseille-Q1617]|uniref:hypothetical protein n=1 Tax=Bacillus sp. Marseille-Q1617 TaxID=2736887 RepID=UPI00158A81C0|nr:hypothetical protein [Bacillus sp. Marseille-Q1617]
MTFMMFHAVTATMMMFFLASALAVIFFAPACIPIMMMMIFSVAIAGMRILDFETFLFNGFTSSGVPAVIMVVVVIIVRAVDKHQVIPEIAAVVSSSFSVAVMKIWKPHIISP